MNHFNQRIHQDLFGSEVAKQANLKALWGIFCLIFFWCQLTACMCYHYDQFTLIGTFSGALLSWTLFLKGKRTTMLTNISAFLVISLTSYLFVKNIVDIIWFGNDHVIIKLFS